MLKLTYKSELGTVVMSGNATEKLRVRAVKGLGMVTRDYQTAIYSGYDGQETIGSRAAARTITLSLEAASEDAAETVREALLCLGCPGTLYIKNEELDRRIFCSQVQIPDVSRVLKGRISTFSAQFVCDNPYFEDGTDTVVPLYRRAKVLETPFSLPTMLGNIVLGATAEVLGVIPSEPVIGLYYPSALSEVESIVIRNETTGAVIKLNYAPKSDDTVFVDIKNRRVFSSVSGNLINNLSADTFLGDFVLVRGINHLTVDVGDVTSDFTMDCRYNNLYAEAVIV